MIELGFALRVVAVDAKVAAYFWARCFPKVQGGNFCKKWNLTNQTIGKTMIRSDNECCDEGCFQRQRNVLGSAG